jgi:hypothetical protein
MADRLKGDPVVLWNNKSATLTRMMGDTVVDMQNFNALNLFIVSNESLDPEALSQTLLVVQESAFVVRGLFVSRAILLDKS